MFIWKDFSNYLHINNNIIYILSIYFLFFLFLSCIVFFSFPMIFKRPPHFSPHLYNFLLKIFFIYLYKKTLNKNKNSTLYRKMKNTCMKHKFQLNFIKNWLKSCKLWMQQYVMRKYQNYWLRIYLSNLFKFLGSSYGIEKLIKLN